MLTPGLVSLVGLFTLPALAQTSPQSPPFASPEPVAVPAPLAEPAAPPASPPFAAPVPVSVPSGPQPPSVLSLLRPPATVQGTPPPVPEASPPAVEENTTNKPEPEVAAPKPSAATLSIGAGVILWYYQPFLKGVKNRAETFYARLTVDGKKGIWGIHLEPRFRDTKQRGFEDGPVFLQESYVSASPGDFVIKVGKSYSHLGLFWDNSFYGNVQVYDGLKLAPDYGINATASHDFKDFKLGYTAQFFLIDGRTNVSLANRDIVSVPNARRRNNLILRVDPELKLGGTNSLRVGLSGQSFQADFDSNNPNVQRGAVDAKLQYDGLGLWAEYIYQHGRHVTDYPITGSAATATTPAVPGHASAKNHYALAGGEYTYGYITARFNFSYANYTQASVHETFFVPAIGFKPIAEMVLLAEYVHWRRYDHGEASFVDRSLNVTAQGFF